MGTGLLLWRMQGADQSHMHAIKVTRSSIRRPYQAVYLRAVPGGARRRLHLLPPFRPGVEVPSASHPPGRRPDFDPDHHIRRVVLGPPPGARRMDRAITAIASTRCLRDRPLWEIVVLEGMPDSHIGFVAAPLA